MRKNRAPRKVVSAQYAIVPEFYPFTLFAQMKNVSRTGALFKVWGDIEVGESVIACPISENSQDELPLPIEVEGHPHCIAGKVVRKESVDLYGVKFTVALKNSPELPVDEYQTSLRVEGDGGHFITLILEGNPSLDDFIHYDSLIRDLSKISMSLVLDFSRVSKLHQSCGAILRKTLDMILKRGKQILFVNAQVLGNHFRKYFPPGKQIQYYQTLKMAYRFLKEHPLKILTVEDDDVTLFHITKYLEFWNFKAITASSAEVGLRMVSQDTPDLVLMDIHLPGMDGISAVKEFRKQIHTYEVPIIVLTQDSTRETVKRTLLNKIEGYVVKPFRPELLLEKIVQALSTYPKYMR